MSSSLSFRNTGSQKLLHLEFNKEGFWVISRLSGEEDDDSRLLTTPLLSSQHGLVLVLLSLGSLQTEAIPALPRVLHDVPVQAHGPNGLSPNTLTFNYWLHLAKWFIEDCIYQICHEVRVIQLCYWLLPWVLATQYCLVPLQVLVEHRQHSA